VSARVTLAMFGAGARHRALRGALDAETEHWRAQSKSIPDPRLRSLALEKLAGEGSHARAATGLATLAPRARRSELARTILAVELLYDYLDGRTEGGAEPEPLLAVYTSACALRAPRVPPGAADRRYLAALAEAVALRLAALPQIGLVREPLAAAARRAADAQARAHRGEGSGTLTREQFAGRGASVLCVHALALRAALPSGPDPQEIDRAYFELATLATLLDGFVDRACGEPESPYTGAYRDEAELAEAITAASARARTRLRALGPHHEMMLSGLIAHYRLSGREKGTRAPALPGELGPVARPALALAALVR
jgi:hypothetical protein